MEATTTSTMSDKERLDLVRWLIESYDERKASVASRAAILLNADALLLAATTFLIDNLWSKADQLKPTEQIILAIGVALALIFLVLSISVATSGIANIWRTSKQKLGDEAPQRLYFYPRRTFEKFKTFSEYADSIEGIDEKQMTRQALGHLWVITQEYKDRYQNLRLATRFLVFAIAPFVFAIAFLLFRSV